MSDSDKTIECGTHGKTRATFVCQHLISGEHLGFNCGYEPDDPDDLYPDAWCDKCETTRQVEGEWNEKSEAISDIAVICAHCYEDTRARNWIQDDQEWNELVSSCCQLFQRRQEKFLSKFKVGDHERWDLDQETGIITFSHEGEPQVEAEIHFVGTYSRKSNTWMWAWANYLDEEKVRSASRRIREFGEEHKFLGLAAHLSDATEEDAGHYTAIMAKELDAIGIYRTTKDELISYMVITKARWVKKKKLFWIF